MVELCNGIVQMNNLPLIKNEEINEILQKISQESRKKLLSRLLQGQCELSTESLARLNEKINDYIKEREILKKSWKSCGKQHKKTEIKKKMARIAEIEEKVEQETKKYFFLKR